jgi:CheY-like chemotaxis protein
MAGANIVELGRLLAQFKAISQIHPIARLQQSCQSVMSKCLSGGVPRGHEASSVRHRTRPAAHGRRRHALFIYMTARDDSGKRAAAEAAGCAAYFRKTDSAAEVLEAIRRLVA